MTDNFDLVYKILEKKCEDSITDDFYFLQILKRRKDNPNQEKDMIVVSSLVVDDHEDLLAKKPNIIKLCNDNNARAYFRLNKRSLKRVALETLKLIATNIAADNYHIRRCYDSCAGQFQSDNDKTWVVDLDNMNILNPLIEDIIDLINNRCDPKNTDKVVEVLPSKSGTHLVSRPFNKLQFRDAYPNIDVHTDNPVILYCP